MSAGYFIMNLQDVRRQYINVTRIYVTRISGNKISVSSICASTVSSYAAAIYTASAHHNIFQEYIFNPIIRCFCHLPYRLGAREHAKNRKAAQVRGDPPNLLVSSGWSAPHTFV
jgi:hypothetical protein